MSRVAAGLHTVAQELAIPIRNDAALDSARAKEFGAAPI